MTVIAMTRQFGTEDDSIADAVCAALGLELLDPPGVDVARQLGADRETVWRLAQEQLSTYRERWRLWEHGALFKMGEQVFAAAERGNALIRGMGAPHLLRAVPHVLLVRVVAPIAHRSEVLKTRWALKDAVEIEKVIAQLDEARTRLNEEAFHIEERQDPCLYDVVLNTGKLTVSDCVSVLTRLSGQPTYQETATGRTKMEDAHFSFRVRAAVSDVPELLSDRAKVFVRAEAETGLVMLSGTVGSRRVAAKIEHIAEAVEGVQSVVNEIEVRPILI